jgi:pantetheine-phosphate adenylyltransferase
VRESIFDILGSLGGVEELDVVDLFCGSGALGVEALSRGAASATFVDRDPDALAAARENLSAVGLHDADATFVRAELPGWLHTPAATSRHGIVIERRGSRRLGGRERASIRQYARHCGAARTTPREQRRSQRRRRTRMKIGLFPGSFDPFHNGHLEIVERASRLFDRVVVATIRNPQKGAQLFDLEERQALLEEVTAHLSSVGIVSMSTLTVWVARDVGADAIIRGLRAVSDFEAEMQMAQMNNHLSGIETIFIPTSPEWSFVASKLVREVWRFGGDVSAFVPEPVAKALAAKYEQGGGKQ